MAFNLWWSLSIYSYQTKNYNWSCLLFSGPNETTGVVWQLLNVDFGIPLFNTTLNEEVCRKLIKHRLCEKHKYVMSRHYFVSVWFLIVCLSLSAEKMLKVNADLNEKVEDFVNSHEVFSFCAFFY